MCVLSGNFTEFPTVLLVPFSALLQLVHYLSLQAGCHRYIKLHCQNWKAPEKKLCLWPYCSSTIGCGVTLFWEALFCEIWKSFVWKQMFKMTRHIELLFHIPMRLFILKYSELWDFCVSTAAYSKRTQLFELAWFRNSRLI